MSKVIKVAKLELPVHASSKEWFPILIFLVLYTIIILASPSCVCVILDKLSHLFISQFICETQTVKDNTSQECWLIN